MLRKVGALPFVSLVSNWSLWFSSVVQFLGNFSWTFLVTLLPRYLAEVFEVPVVKRGWMAGFPILVGMFGMFAGGWHDPGPDAKSWNRWPMRN